MKDRSAAYRYESADGMKASNLLEFLAQGGRDEKSIRELADKLLEYVETRKDCADFRAAYLVRVLLSFKNELPKDLFDHIKRAVLDFPYEDCGGHSMCTWTENHRLYTAVTEYLLAVRFPEEIFGDGKDAAYHLEHGKKELNEDLEEMLKYGFAEWESNNYYSETMAGLANTVQFVNDEEISEKARKALLMMVYDVLSQTSNNGGYIYNPACGRAYADNKTSSDQGNYLEPQIMAMRGEKVTCFKEKEGCMVLLLAARDKDGKPVFEIPEPWKKLPDKNKREICLMQGVDIDEYKAEGLAEYSRENVRSAFKAGAISDYRVICNSMRYLRETGLVENGMLKALKPFANPLFYRTGLLRLIKKHVPTGFDGAAMEKGRVYTYACKDYSISAAFDYRVGQVLFQQNPLAVNLGYRISLFVTNPYSDMGKTGSPGYWIGSGAAPRAVACKNFAACMFDPEKAPKGAAYTHLFFPTGLFDETDLSGLKRGVLFGRTGNVNVFVRTNPGVRFVPSAESREMDRALLQDNKIPKGVYTKKYDLINSASGLHYYVFEVDSKMGFAEFKAYVREREFNFYEEERTLVYGLYDCRLEYDGAFTVGGKEFKPDFKRPMDVIKELTE
jgi:hypothetical protein